MSKNSVSPATARTKSPDSIRTHHFAWVAALDPEKHPPGEPDNGKQTTPPNNGTQPQQPTPQQGDNSAQGKENGCPTCPPITKN